MSLGKPGSNEGMDLNVDPRLTKTSAETSNIPFSELLASQSLLSRNNNIVELKDIKNSLNEQIEAMRRTATMESNRLSIPKIYDLSSVQSPNLPGIVLVCTKGDETYLMPVLFYKKGAAENGEAYKGVPSAQRTAESYVNAKMRERISAAFRKQNNVEMRVVKTISTYVIDVEQYAADSGAAAENIAEVILREWYNGSLNFSIMAHAKAKNGGKATFPCPFRDGALFGAEGQAIARINAVPQPYMPNGRPTPYNLMVTLCTGGRRGDSRYPNEQQETRIIASTALNLSLEVRTPEDYRAALNDPKLAPTRGPLVPVISLGRTVPGEQFLNNDSIMNDILGMYAQLIVNDPVNFSEAFRSSTKTGVRGTLANLATAAYEASGIRPPEGEALTVQTMGQQHIVEKFMRTYISPSPAFVLDLPTYVDSPSNAEWWWNMLLEPQLETDESTKQVRKAAYTPYRDSFVMMVDAMSKGGLSQYLMETANNPDEWKVTDPILVQSSTIIPVGTARYDGQLFALEEIDQQFLRSPVHYGDNQQAIANLMSLYNGNCNKDMRQRQQEIGNLFNYLFGDNVSVVGWRSRWIFQDKALRALSAAMSRAGGISVQTWSGAEKWSSHASNDYLNQTTTASVNTTTHVGMMVGGVNNNWKNR